MEGFVETSSQQHAPTLEQLTLEVKFYLGQTAQNIIEVGKRLTQAKEMVPHGEWQNWLKDNFQLSYRMAAKFMQCSERFGNMPSKALFSQTQMIEMLALPAAETETFIEAKTAEGNPVENMTIKTLREEVQQWKSKAERATEDNERGKTYNVAIRKDRDRLKAALYDAEQKLQKQPQVIIQPPDDYEQVKLDLAKLRNFDDDEKGTSIIGTLGGKIRRWLFPQKWGKRRLHSRSGSLHAGDEGEQRDGEIMACAERFGIPHFKCAFESAPDD